MKNIKKLVTFSFLLLIPSQMLFTFQVDMSTKVVQEILEAREKFKQEKQSIIDQFLKDRYTKPLNYAEKLILKALIFNAEENKLTLPNTRVAGIFYSQTNQDFQTALKSYLLDRPWIYTSNVDSLDQQAQLPCQISEQANTIQQNQLVNKSYWEAHLWAKPVLIGAGVATGIVIGGLALYTHFKNLGGSGSDPKNS